MKKLICLGMALALTLVAPVAMAAVETIYAHQTGTIQANGPRTGVNGDRFFNIQGANSGTNASYGALRFDLSSIKAGFDAEFGAGLWLVDDVKIRFTQDNSWFTNSGNVAIYYAPNDTVNIKTGSAVVYSDKGAPLGVDVVNDDPLAQVTFTIGTTGQLDTYTLDFGKSAALLNDILSGDLLTLMVIENNDAGVSATWRGQDDFQGRMPPELIVSAVAVPEPGTIALLLLGSLGAIRRRK